MGDAHHRRAHQGGWVINGTKQWITGSPHASWVLLFAVTDAERSASVPWWISAFFVPMDAQGVRVDSVIKLFGSIGGNQGIISFNDVVVDDHQLVGTLDDGFDVALGTRRLGGPYLQRRTIDRPRTMGARTDRRLRKHRTTFGASLMEHQRIAFQLAECAMQIYASKQMTLDCARQLDEGQPAVRDLRSSRRSPPRHAVRSTTGACRLRAAWASPMRWACTPVGRSPRIIRIADGSGEMMRRTITAALARGDLAFDKPRSVQPVTGRDRRAERDQGVSATTPSPVCRSRSGLTSTSTIRSSAAISEPTAMIAASKPARS